MKEITFEELVKEHEWFSRDDFSKREPLFDKVDILKILKQVREATIEECKDKTWNKHGIYRKAYEIRCELDNLPTDRIKIKP